MPKACRSWSGKTPQLGTPKQERARKVNWALFILGGAIGTLESLTRSNDVLAGIAWQLNAALESLRMAQSTLRMSNAPKEPLQ